MKNKYIEYITRILDTYQLRYELEYKFCETRRWKADIALITHNLLIEFEGGMFVKSRHRTGVGYSKDTEKYNRAVIAGWRVLRYTSLTIGNAEKEILEIIDGGRYE